MKKVLFTSIFMLFAVSAVALCMARSCTMPTATSEDEAYIEPLPLGQQVIRLKPSKKVGDKHILDSRLIKPELTSAYYLIEHNYDLRGETLIIPRGCVLDFRGGSISNGTLQADFATINAPAIPIFQTDLKLTGNWQNHSLPVEWYGAIGDNKTNSTDAINAAINNTTFHVVSLMAGAKYRINHAIKMRSSDLSFGCFEVSYSHEDSPAAYIYSDCGEHILEFPKGETVKGICLKGMVLHKTGRYNYQGDGIHIQDASFYRSVLEGVRIYYCNNGFYQHFDKDYRGYSLNKMQNCVFSGCLFGFTLTHDEGGHLSYWVNLNSWDNCHFGFNKYGGLTIHNVYSCEQNMFSSCGFEGVSWDALQNWNVDSDVYGARLNGQGYGLTTFENCYFERNHPQKFKTKPTSALNESSKYCISDVIIEGMLVSFNHCTFNDGITPIVIRDGNIGVTIENTIFRTGYDSDHIVLFKGVSSEHTKEGNYLNIDIPYIERKFSKNMVNEVNCATGALNKSINCLTIR